MLTILSVGDKVVLDDSRSSLALSEGLLSGLSEGPLTVAEVIPVPRDRCTCSIGDYFFTHDEQCEITRGPWGSVGHPQWLVLSDSQGNVLKSKFHDGPSLFSGLWFKKEGETRCVR